jgi:hypothetical protein
MSLGPIGLKTGWIALFFAAASSANAITAITASGQMIPPDKIDTCRLDHLPNASLPQIVDSIIVGGSQVSTHATIMVRDNHSASAGWLHLVDSISDLQTSRMARRQ